MVKPFRNFVTVIEAKKIDDSIIDITISIIDTENPEDKDFNITLIEKNGNKDVYSIEDNNVTFTHLDNADYYLFILKNVEVLKMFELDLEKEFSKKNI